ncbi:hypothetical protein [Salinarimonas soli]|uniref:Uncharacterized protein n=1 Tax=Salinarimonas soli TaxID=1638099 RepID=A0A5B2V9P8_9HYPH|nr:hypothetical protein [Salinarimonas soli]KAA2234967.1 hypothetical protein F0L46_21740 [Salinarimonas soli]
MPPGTVDGSAERDEEAPEGGARRVVLVAGLATTALLVAAGGLLWSRLGAAVFSDYVLSGLAWCL